MTCRDGHKAYIQTWHKKGCVLHACNVIIKNKIKRSQSGIPDQPNLLGSWSGWQSKGTHMGVRAGTERRAQSGLLYVYLWHLRTEVSIQMDFIRTIGISQLSNYGSWIMGQGAIEPNMLVILLWSSFQRTKKQRQGRRSNCYSGTSIRGVLPALHVCQWPKVKWTGLAVQLAQTLTVQQK